MSEDVVRPKTPPPTLALSSSSALATPERISLKPQKPNPRPSPKPQSSTINGNNTGTSSGALRAKPSAAGNYTRSSPGRGGGFRGGLGNRDVRPGDRTSRERDARDRSDGTNRELPLRRDGPMGRDSSRELFSDRNDPDRGRRRDFRGREKTRERDGGFAVLRSDSRGSSPEPAETSLFRPVERKEQRYQFHPLESSWTFWFDKRGAKARKPGAKSWESNLREVGHFNNVEYFWRYFHHLEKPSNLELNSNYHLFRSGVKPMWEDDANKDGGKWIVRLGHRERYSIDTYWQNLVLGLIGEVYNDSQDICGAVMSRRKGGDRIAVWNKDRNNVDAIMRLGHKIREILSDGSPNTITLQYSYHEDAIKTGSSAANPPQYNI